MLFVCRSPLTFVLPPISDDIQRITYQHIFQKLTMTMCMFTIDFQVELEDVGFWVCTRKCVQYEIWQRQTWFVSKMRQGDDGFRRLPLFYYRSQPLRNIIWEQKEVIIQIV